MGKACTKALHYIETFLVHFLELLIQSTKVPGHIYFLLNDFPAYAIGDQARHIFFVAKEKPKSE